MHQVRLVSWNAGGLTAAKASQSSVRNLFRDFDVICLQETWWTTEQAQSKAAALAGRDFGFKVSCRPSVNYKQNHGGGVVTFWRKSMLQTPDVLDLRR